MADAIRLVSIRQGYDPRQCTLVVAGGAGAVHAAAIARELGIRRLLIPREASVFCAAGMLLSDLRHDYVRTFSGELSTIPRDRVAELYKEMSAEALRTLAEEGIHEKDAMLSYAVDLKYVGQFHEVTIPFSALAENLVQLQPSFDARHRALYGYNLTGQPVEALHWRLTAVGRTERPQFSRIETKCAGGIGKRSRQVIFDGRAIATDVFRGGQLGAQAKIQGPAIVEEPTTTIVIPPGCELAVNEYGDYEVEL
jgi:N-methylhydantoinase A